MYQPRVSEMKQYQRQAFNKIRAMLKQGKIPAGLINPALLCEHNENSPQVAHIMHSEQEVSLDALAIHYAVNGIGARKFFNDNIRQPRGTATEQREDLGARSRRDRHADIMENLR